MTSLHDTLTVIDGLVVSKWSRAVFADMRNGGLTAANCTCSIWEGFVDTMRNVAQWKRWFGDNADLITPVHRGGYWPGQGGRKDRDYPRVSEQLGV
jgi:membrane dipeptidase